MVRKPPRHEPHIASITLCGGRGTRMGTHRISKVCLPVAGVPAILRTLSAYRQAGVQTNILVVGRESTDVLRVVGNEFPDAVFVFQPEPRGTGDAAMRGAMPLLDLGFDGPVFVGVGDKVLDQSAVAQVLDSFRRHNADLSLAVTDKPDATDMGRLVYDDAGRPLGLIEAVELRLARLQRRLLKLAGGAEAIDPAALRRICLRELGQEKHLKRLGRLARLLDGRRPIAAERLATLLPQGAGLVRVGRRQVTPERVVDGPPHMNESLYLFKAEALARGFELLGKARRKGECYVTDIVHLLAQDRPPAIIDPVVIDRDTLIVGFNTPAQLLALEELVRTREGRAARVATRDHGLDRRTLKRAGAWLEMFDEAKPAADRALRELYGDDPARLGAKREEVRDVLRRFVDRFDAKTPVVIARAPGSVNLMGRHVDVEGGYVNMMTIDREAVFVAGARRDDRIRVAGDGAHFRDAEFTLGGELAALDWDDWLQYVSSAKVRRIIAASRDDRSNYVKAAALRLQQEFHEAPLAGMDCAVGCPIPSAAGLGASAAIVAAATEALAALNGLDLTPEQVTNLCAEGEWYVTPGATAGEHVAGRLGRGEVAQVRFHPMEVHARVTFPDAWRVLLCRLPDGAELSLDLRRRQSAALHLGLMLLRQRFPRFAHLIERVRDLDAERLGVPTSEVLSMLGALPESVAPKRVKALFPATLHAHIDELLADHEPPAEYRLREVVTYGAAECLRSRRFADVLAAGRAADLAAMMAASHDAERAAAGGWSADDASIQQRIADLRSEDPDRVRRAQLWMQPGRYGASAPELDAVVDALAGLPGVIGAQLSGTGQGGTVMALASADAVDAVREALASLDADVSPALSVPGAGLLST